MKIENLLSQVEGVAEVAVVGLLDVKWGERPHAVVVPKPDYQNRLTADALRQALQVRVDRGELNKWYVPDRVLFVS